MLDPDPDPLLLAPEFDDDLPVYPRMFPVPDRTPYGYAVDMGVIRSEFAAGNSRQRRAFRVMPHALALTFHMRFEELTSWQNWVNVYAYGWFHCPVSTMYAGAPPNGANLRHELLRFTGNLAIQSEGWDWIGVSVSAELSPDAFAQNPGWGLGGWIIGGTPKAPALDWIIGGTPAAPSLDTITAGSPGIPAIPSRSLSP